MLIVYFSSVTENTARFVQKLDIPALRVPLLSSDVQSFTVEEPYVLFTPTYGAGSKGFVPKQVVKLLNMQSIRENCVGVVGLGNRNFNEDFCRAADIISAKLQVPLLYRLELAGTEEDVTIVQEGMNQFWQKFQKSHRSTSTPN